MAAALIKFETLDTEQIDDIMSGKPPRPPQDWLDDDSSPTPTSERETGDGDVSEDGKIGGPASLH